MILLEKSPINLKFTGTLMMLIVFTSCENLLPSCEVLSTEADTDIFLINGEADAGYKIIATVRNNGQAGSIHLKATISCSEGDFFRERKLHFKQGERRTITFTIHEPTINATDVRYGVTGWP